MREARISDLESELNTSKSKLIEAEKAGHLVAQMVDSGFIAEQPDGSFTVVNQ